MRPDLEIICDWIKPGSKVLDLGCGDGVLLKHLITNCDVRGLGMEIDDADIVRCIERDVAVIQADLNEGLSKYFDRQMFDYVVMTHTLQALPHPHRLLEEMLSVGKEGIVTFPNIGHWRNRLHLLLSGKMPITKVLPAIWYETENIRLCTLRDFEDLCRDKNIRILKRAAVDSTHRHRLSIQLAPNLLGESAIYCITKGPPG